jgi:carbon-monoxide dehydrogenase iron sulfur subunit
MDNKNKTIVVNIKKCLACKSCEIACAMVHSHSEALEEAILKSPKPQGMLTVEAAGEFGLPIQCRHCQDAQCIEICPTGAIYRDSEQAPVVVDEQLCIGCKMCMLICPFGILQINKKGRAIIKCDMCIERIEKSLDPACVEACPTKALSFVLLDQSEKAKIVKPQVRSNQRIKKSKDKE